MDDLNQNTAQNYTDANPYSTGTPPTSPTAVEPAASENVVYANVFQRFLAVLIDGILIGIVTGVLSGLFSALGESAALLGNLVSMAISFVYYVYFISQRGQTLGKQALGIRVQNEVTGQNLDVTSAFLREVVGKFISAVVLLLGYFWMLWDPKKQTWHDKIAKSVVIIVK